MNRTIPEALAARPIDPKRNLPTPWANEHVRDDGTVDVNFAVVSNERAFECTELRLCGLCGEGLDYWITFLGGPKAAELRTYGDPPMHEACAIASLDLCPHLAVKRHKRRQVHRQDDDGLPPGWIDTKPDRWILGYTRDFKLKMVGGYAIFFAAPFKQVRVFAYDDNEQLHEVA
ncbi:hypothetical protein [Amycolatopsis anabasis]|uniref:hypothetical protein n=1 Tax=Amycolatopsis anabasis TaxID=1840409 RepID=UPI00131A7AAC|nr:hypothetical protein [Amycolatopsis anabasis]